MAYGLWVAVQYGMLHLGLEVAPEGRTADILFFGSAAASAFFGFFLTSTVLVHAEGPFSEHPSTRKVYVLAALTVGLIGSVVIKAAGATAPVVFIIHSAHLLVFAVLLGAWLATAVRRLAEIVLLCVLMLWVDFLSVFLGPTRYLARTISDYYRGGRQGPVPWSDLLLVKTVVPGLENPYPIFGVSDWIIIVFLSAAAARFQVDDNIAGKGLGPMTADRKVSLYISVPLLGLLVSLLVAQLTASFIPALSVISLLFLCHIYARYRPLVQMERRDWAAILVFTAVAVLVIGVQVFRWIH